MCIRDRLIIIGRDKQRLSATYSELDGNNHIQINADLTDESTIDKVIDELPCIDGIANIAGIVKTLPFHFISKKELDKVFDINFFAPVLL